MSKAGYPQDGQIRYDSYSIQELREALAGIDAKEYPINFANLRHEISRRPECAASGGFDAFASQPDPAEIPKPPKSESEMINLTVLSGLLLAYMTYGWAKGDMVFPLRARSDHLRGTDAEFMYAFVLIAFLCNVSRLIAWLVYDNADNNWYRYGEFISRAMCILLIAYMVATLFW